MSGWETTAEPTGAGWTAEPEAAAAPATDDARAVRLGASPQPRETLEALLALPPSDRIRIDASEVERLSGPVLQILAAAMREATARGERVGVVNPSFAFTLAFEAYGLGGDNEPFTAEYC